MSPEIYCLLETREVSDGYKYPAERKETLPLMKKCEERKQSPVEIGVIAQVTKGEEMLSVLPTQSNDSFFVCLCLPLSVENIIPKLLYILQIALCVECYLVVSVIGTMPKIDL